MSYLLDRQNKRNKIFGYTLLVLLVIFVFYFRNGLSKAFSRVGSLVFHPVLYIGNGLGNRISDLGGYFATKSSLLKTNEALQAELDQARAGMVNYDAVLAENNSLKEVLGRTPQNKKLILAAILAKPNQSPYDILLIDIGSTAGIKGGAMVYADGSVPIGTIAEADANTAKVNLFSSPGQKTEVVIGTSNAYMELLGRGGGNFELELPGNMSVQKGEQALLPGLTPTVIAVAVTTISDPREAFQKALFMSPINIQALRFVEVAE